MEAEKFSFGIDESWDAVEKVLSYHTCAVGRCGVDALRSRWESAKAELLDLIDPTTGRMEITIEFNGDDAVKDYVATLDLVSWSPKNAVLFYIDKKRRLLFQPEGAVGVVTVSHDSIRQRAVRYAVAVIMDDVTLEEVALNRLELSRYDPRPGREGKLIPAGTKLGGYVRECAIHKAGCTVEEAQLIVEAFSQLTAALKPQPVTVVLSVNPLDILLASEHTSGWRSCHRLGGEHATGPIAYMVDGVTAIAYAYSTWKGYAYASKLILPVKTWRQMVYFDLAAASCIMSRHYPGDKPLYEAYVRKMAARVIAKKYGVEKPRWKLRRLDPSLGTANAPGAEEAYEDERLPLKGYAVWGRGWCYTDAPSSGIRLSCGDVEGTPTCIYVGAYQIPCVCCGEPREETRDSNCQCHLVCPECGNYGVFCESCREYLGPTGDDAYEAHDGAYYCEDCWHELFTYCYRCGATVDLEDALSGCNEEYYCDRCWDLLFCTCVSCSSTVWRDDAYWHDGDSYCEACFANQFAVCAECGEDVPVDDALVGPDGESYCRECFERLFVECYSCGEPMRKEDAVTVCFGGGKLGVGCSGCVSHSARGEGVCGLPLVDADDCAGCSVLCELEGEEVQIA